MPTPPATTPSPAPMSFEEHAVQEHRHLTDVLEDVAVLTGRESYLQAAKRFGEFRRLLERHVTAEERVVLPLFIERTGDSTGVGERLRTEHTHLLHLMDNIGSAISRWDRAAFDNLIAELSSALHEHDASEGAVLHPALNDLIATAADWRCLCANAGVEC